ncbi:DUF930 domain-containing protein [Mesorhizobium sp. AR07]|uniref:DUF930 domain-containing protein n=1 Tax=Mesorhizobium sp. AR07 TaxID=2865838 RepID=UPI00215F322E|nr:DUF930 domain-containing protein [Mesorhizobium sp. AR07]UVK46556.1 DUF930 domain-containing protein [Mesorhizobium sp. AR07]
MKDETRERRRTLLWALPASLILHALITALLVYGLPMPPQQPQEEQAVNVALVPPPDQPKPKPAPAPPPKKPEAKKPPEPKVEKPPEQNVEKPPAPEKPSPVEVLRPVFQFGDKDAGPRKSLDGSSAQDNSPSPAKDKDSKPPVVPKDAENKSAASPDSGERADPTKVGEKPVTAAKDIEPTQEKQATSTQDMGNQEADKQQAGAAAAATPLAAAGGDIEIALPTSAEAPKPRPENAPKPSPAKVSKSGSGSARRPSSTDVAAAASRVYSDLPGVRRLYSQGATGDALATMSMADVPRYERAGQLCASTLYQQLENASYIPDWVPAFRLNAGNIIDQPNTHFRTRTTWYDLSFRCEVDTNATRVLSFAFRVGPETPPDESARLERSVPH